VIVFLSDFGTQDHYVGVVKGVISSFSPEARIIDLTHELEPQNIEEALYRIWSCYTYFPVGSVFLIIVDPSVGTERDIIVLKFKERLFIAPDNGILSPFIQEATWIKRLRKGIRFFSKTSSTFHGRDLFAPLAAFLDRGEGFEYLEVMQGYPKHIEYKPVFKGFSQKEIHGRIAYVDRFGNVVTNIKMKNVPFKSMQIYLNNHCIEKKVSTYSYAKKGELVYLEGSSGFIEISVKNGSAFQKLGLNKASDRKVLIKDTAVVKEDR
jgi:S-adenosylmethionine hydrolase